MTIWFTGDQHFGHEKIIGYCGRPFGSVEEMDRVMVERWNERVAEDDTVYHLGDFSLDGWHVVHHILHKLNGKIFILATPWHHDKRWMSTLMEVPGFVCFSGSGKKVYTASPIVVLDFDKSELGIENDGYPQGVVLCHYPFHTWDRKHYGSWHLYGHTHQKDPQFESDRFPRTCETNALNVGVDAWDFYPVSLEQVKEVLSDA
jgi:calcineurin-like phosphoesterase family protein